MAVSGKSMTEIDCVTRRFSRCAADSLGSFDDQSGRNIPQEIFRCRICGHGVTMPPLSDLGSLYEGRNSQDFQPNTRGLSRYIKEMAFRIQARRLLRQLIETPRTMLDYGCGSGQLTRVVGDLLPTSAVTGADFFDTPPPELAHEHYMSFAQLEESNAVFDAVLALHVLEHDNTPGILLQRLMRFVRPGGELIIEVPNIDCPWGRILGKHWDVWYVPFHRHHFSRASLQALIESEGLLMDSIVGVAVPSMGRSIANLFRLPKNIVFLLVGIGLHPIQIMGETVSGQPTALRATVRRPVS